MVSLLNEISKYIPIEYSNITNFLLKSAPYLILIFSILTCFLGYKLHRFWVGVCFAVIDFCLGCSVSFFIPQISIGISIFVGIILAILTIIFSFQLYRFQLFAINFISSYVIFSGIFCSFLPNFAGIILGIIFAIFVGILAMKYMYIVTIITTSITGSFLTFMQLFSLSNLKYNLIYYILAIIFAFIGMFIQFKTCNKHLEKE